MHRYLIQTKDGLKYRPSTLNEVERLVKLGWIKPTTMVFTESTSQWRLAATVAELRELLQKHPHVRQSSLQRIQAHPKSEARPSSQIQKTPFFSRFFKKGPGQGSRLEAGEKQKEACVISLEPHLSQNISMELYTIRGSDGVEYGPCSIEQVKELVRQGRVKATTMVFTQTTQRWHLAASLAEIRVFLRKYNPSQDSTLNKIRALGPTNARDSTQVMRSLRRISTVRMKHPFWKHPFWKKFFSRD